MARRFSIEGNSEEFVSIEVAIRSETREIIWKRFKLLDGILVNRDRMESSVEMDRHSGMMQMGEAG